MLRGIDLCGTSPAVVAALRCMESLLSPEMDSQSPA